MYHHSLSLVVKAKVGPNPLTWTAWVQFPPSPTHDMCHLCSVMRGLMKPACLKYAPNRLFQEYRPTKDALYQNLKENNCDIEWGFHELFLSHKFENIPLKIEINFVLMKFEMILEASKEEKRMGIITSNFNFFCLISQQTVDYEIAIIYSTKEKKEKLK